MDSGIVPDAVKAYVNLSGDLSRFGKVEGDNVGVEVVVQECSVYFQEPLIGTEDIINRVDPFPLLFKQGEKKFFKSGSLLQAN